MVQTIIVSGPLSGGQITLSECRARDTPPPSRPTASLHVAERPVDRCSAHVDQLRLHPRRQVQVPMTLHRLKENRNKRSQSLPAKAIGGFQSTISSVRVVILTFLIVRS